MILFISACLMGVSCRYDGGAKTLPCLAQLMARYQVIPVCPEILGGLPTPRPPAERQGRRVLCKDGADVTQAYLHGAQETLKLARLYGCSCAVLKERSPSCGFGQIYDGTFSGRLVPGGGTAAELLAQNGVRVLGESSVETLL
ncbi:MAG: DUF523 domain-containing protein [Oscillospiraceae bacterium]|jgi:uncharacterized protein YbbK (DUF523 family)|nr:DUF523 domain-containing protein [Oscillospiraceae bacterium]MDD3260678.1 DUF523 domain-containing protein [Oscillospiraceae bacterium]